MLIIQITLGKRMLLNPLHHQCHYCDEDQNEDDDHQIILLLIRCMYVTYSNVFDDQRQFCRPGNHNFCLSKDINMFCSEVIILNNIIIISKVIISI